MKYSQAIVIASLSSVAIVSALPMTSTLDVGSATQGPDNVTNLAQQQEGVPTNPISKPAAVVQKKGRTPPPTP